MHPPTLAEQPAITPSTPWEAYGLAAVQVVEWAVGDKRLYYSCRELLPGRNAKGEQNVASRLCLAKSADGKTWRRPALGLIEHPPGSGNTSNNIVWPPTHPNGSAASPFSPRMAATLLPRCSGYALWYTLTTHSLTHLPPASSPVRLVWHSALQAPS